ncbi:hypothetical protein, partial [Klebsiella pneumoniae]|uniref:hypothetical protein n=1 Tax=Klebsiella pneumoniae TaxID=573 RepID=UPI00210D0BE1
MHDDVLSPGDNNARHYSRLQLCTENSATPGALNRLPQHVSEKNVAFMALLCVYAVIRQIIQEGLASFSGTPTF